MTSEDQTDREEDAQEDTSGRTAALPDPAATDRWLGRKFAGRYVVEGQLGVGTVVRTLRARDEQSGATVTIKSLCAAQPAESLSRRMLRQAEAVRAIDHPHIARVLEHGSDDRDGPFVCREFVEGQDLSSAVERAVLTPRRIVELLMQVLSALSEAHRHGVLHGNLKPQNIIVTRDAQAQESLKLCDFGELGDVSTGAAYRAPEQGQGTRAIDGQADVYAVGVLLYELLTDEVPLRGATVDETLKLHAHASIEPPTIRRPERPVPPELEAVCLKALEKEPSKRHRSPREMSQALRAVVHLLGARADEPLGSSAFSADGRRIPVTASTERMTMPGEQLRSHTKIWLGAALVAGVCAAVYFGAQEERYAPRERDAEARSLPPFITGSVEQRGEGSQALESGMARLRSGNAHAAVVDLRAARTALGDTPEVLRALGEALVIEGNATEGVELLERYLALDPTARDRKFVESLIRQGTQR
jgi:hypothetical protein